MDEFKSKALFHKNRFTEDNNPKKTGRKSARHSLKLETSNLMEEALHYFDCCQESCCYSYPDLSDWWEIDGYQDLKDLRF